VSLERIQAEDCNLNIRRYADNSPPPEPQDVRAHLIGGVPKAEIEAHRPRFESHGLDVSRLFVERDAKYVDFTAHLRAPVAAGRRTAVEEDGSRPAAGTHLDSKAAIRQAVRDDPGLAARERELMDAFARWWRSATARLAQLPETGDPIRMRAEWIESFGKALQRVGLLDRFQLVGALVSWWDEAADEIRIVHTHQGPILRRGHLAAFLRGNTGSRKAFR